MLQQGAAAETMKKLEPRHHTDPVRDETKTLNDSGTQVQFVISCVSGEEPHCLHTDFL